MSSRTRRRAPARPVGRRARGRRCPAVGGWLRDAWDPRSGAPGAQATVAGLLGVSAGLALVGLTQRLGGTYVGAGSSEVAILGGSLAALALGLFVPQQLAAWWCTQAWRRLVRGGATEAGGPLPAPGEPTLRWLALGIITLLTGLACAALPVLTAGADRLYIYLLNQFVWLPAAHSLLQALLALAVAGVPLAGLGLAIGMVHRLGPAATPWSTSATGWVLLGGAGGAAAGTRLLAAWGRPELVMLVAALPPLLVAVAGVAMEQRSLALTPADRPAAGSADPPTYSDRWPRLLRVGLVLVAGAAALLVQAWGRLHAAAGTDLPHLTPWCWAGAGLGAWLGSHLPGGPRRSVGGFGVACVVAGLSGAVATFAALLALAGPAATPAWLPLLLLGGMLPFGVAWTLGLQAALCRTAQHGELALTTAARALLAAAAVVWLAGPALLLTLGGVATVAAAVLLVLAWGGVLIIHEPDCGVRTRRVQLGLSFAAVAAVTLLLRWVPAGATAQLHTPAPPARSVFADHLQPPASPAGESSAGIGPSQGPTPTDR